MNLGTWELEYENGIIVIVRQSWIAKILGEPMIIPIEWINDAIKQNKIYPLNEKPLDLLATFKINVRDKK